ncbi:MAG: porin family protein [Planctomycetales bacterium]|nr:porin family protein [Planctomycetales bacterium]
MVGTLCALLLATNANAQTSANPLRKLDIGGPASLEPKSLETAQARARVAATKQIAASPRRFTDYEVWGEEAPTTVRPGLNPLRQAQYSEELPRPAAPTPQQALRANGWDDTGPGEYPNEMYDESADPWHNTLFSHGWFVHTDPNDPHRSIGWGEPLVGTSWRNRPWYVGAFIGGIFPSDLISGHVRQNNSALGWLRLGYDFDHYWGIEGRFGYSNPHLTMPDGTPLGVSRNYLADVELLYYPWGDSCWRPYVTLGLGQATFRFMDDQSRVVHESLLSMPFGCGLKYFHSPQTTIRFDLVENFAFGSHTIDNQANLSLMAAVEFRFGGRRPSYFPWHGNTVGW